jgi:hypothetical protein
MTPLGYSFWEREFASSPFAAPHLDQVARLIVSDRRARRTGLGRCYALER